ncbi:unnamed protein product [marine sediment metagenome]|uniref:Uncharacterized protein n=1 Tax=marine sediment metagenome TaxID=412755 RepID=X0SZN2_9ZZZZ
MNNFGYFLTPKEAYDQDARTKNGRREPLSFYEDAAKNDSICEVCEMEKVWKLVDCGMCFSCTTGEADASDDYELIAG